MPKGHRSVRSQGYFRLSPSIAPAAQYSDVSTRANPAMPTSYYPTDLSLSQSYGQPSNSGYSNGGPVQHPLSTPQYTQPQSIQAPSPAPVASIRPSSGAWTPTDDQTLMVARAQGMNWAPIQQAYFPTKTPNACRKRHERLMERRSADDWDGMKLETMAKCYMNMRREIWSGLAAQTGEKWTVVEQKCMSQGLKNLQTSARSCARRERLLEGTQSSHPHSSPHHSLTNSLHHHPEQNPYGTGAYADQHTDDSGIGIEDLDAEYVDGASDRSSAYAVGHGGGYGHQHSHSGGSGGSGSGRDTWGHAGGVNGGRLPSMDMGIDAIINRPGGGR